MSSAGSRLAVMINRRKILENLSNRSTTDVVTANEKALISQMEIEKK